MDSELMKLGKALATAKMELESAKLNVKEKKEAMEAAQYALNAYAHAEPEGDDE